MKWIMVADAYSSLRSLLQGQPVGQGSATPARFVEFVLRRGDEVTLVLPAHGIPGSQLAPKLSHLRIEPVGWGKTSWRRLFDLRLCYRKLAEIAARERPDVVYCSGYQAIPSALYARRHALPAVSRFYGTFLTQLSRPRFLLSRYAPKLLAEALAMALSKDGLIITDDGTRGDAVCRRLRIPQEKLLFLRNGVDEAQLEEIRKQTDVAAVRTALGLDPEDFVIASVCRLTAWKRVDLVISAFAALPNFASGTTRRTVLLIAGSGREEARLKVMAAASPRAADIRFLGEQSREMTLKIMRSSDAITSFYEVSNVGNVLLEALRLGRPVIARATGATPSVIRHGDNGFLVPEDNASAIREFGTILPDLVGDNRRHAAVCENALRWARRNLSDWEQRFQREYDWIRERVKRRAV